MRSAKRDFVKTISRKSAAVFLLGVFLLFSTIGLTMDMTQMGRQPLLRLVLTLLVISTFAVLYAVIGFTLRRQSWLMMFVPIFIVEWFLMVALNSWIGSLAPLNLANPSSVMHLQKRLNVDGVAVIVTMCLGYSCFVYASVREGRRYFLAHAEIALAQEIHQVLVPTIDANIGGFEFYGRSAPSSEVGGDLIDLAEAGHGWVAYLADVSGHGVAPGVVVGMTKSSSRMLLTSGEGSEHLMRRLNEVLYPLKKPDMFVTFCFVASANGDRLRVGLAGHPSILQFCRRTNEVTEIECSNMPLGIIPTGEFATSEIVAQSGTVFALYTDGFLETANKAGEEFGVSRLKAELQKHGKEPLGAICQSIRESVSRHGGQFDDQSILLIRKV
jgi:Stage II sporulation protein E (SpoIIE)